MTTQERTSAVLKELPPDKAEAVLDFAQSLAEKSTQDEALADARWDRC